LSVFTASLASILGLVTLTYGADVLVRGSSRLAIQLGVSPLLVGLTIVAYGTSAPELVARSVPRQELPLMIAATVLFGLFALRLEVSRPTGWLFLALLFSSTSSPFAGPAGSR
jgi:Ca2+/Na+ antiporter